MSKLETTIGYSPLTEKVYLGKANKEKGLWVGDKKEITDDYLQVLFQYVPSGNSRQIRQGDDVYKIINIDWNNIDHIDRGILFLQSRRQSLKEIEPQA